MKPKHILLLVSIIIIITLGPQLYNKPGDEKEKIKEESTYWDAFPEGVNWNGEIYVLLYPIGDEINYYKDYPEMVKKYHPIIEHKIGKVLNQTNDSLKVSGNSNCMKKGTRLYKIKGVSTDAEIAGKLKDGLYYRFIKQDKSFYGL